MSAHVSRCGCVKDASVSNPQDARILLLNGTVTWCVTSCTESILPAVPQNTWKSAARATPERIVSRSRCGTLPTVEYPCTWNSLTVSFPALMRRPAFWLAFVIWENPLTPGATPVQAPTLGKHMSRFGSAVFSFGVPDHQRGPLLDELAGLLLAWPRPQAVIRQEPGRVTPALP